MGREAILKSIKENKPELLTLPEIDLNEFQEEIDLIAAFKEKVAMVGGSILELDATMEIDTEIKKRYPNAVNIANCTLESSLEGVQISKNNRPHEYENIDLAIVKGELGVAENGAVWISDTQFPIRVLPFITNDLVIVLDKKDICAHLHQAYSFISKRDRSFGVFIAGPSKTADIEQCLVVGAQGAMSLPVMFF